MERRRFTIWSVIIPIIVFFIGCIAMLGFIKLCPSLFKTNITKLVKDVTVTDKGIADSVEKIYDAVVVVSNYKNGKLASTGTGFVFTSDKKTAFVLTNNHVIEGGKNVNLTFTNGKVVEATVVGTDALADIAVLSVPKDEVIAYAEIGDSEALRVGDTAFAVGAPLDSVYSWTVTRGIISGKDRMVEVEISSSTGEYVMKVLQTDAAINSGNSGGPLCNANGQVVGITSLKLVDESVEGMGFAIPIEVALSYAEKLMKGEKIVQPYLGISMINVTDALYKQQYFSMLNEQGLTNGVLVDAIEKDSPAFRGGIASGDVIVKINGSDVSSIGYLRYYLYNYAPGDTITITVIRKGETKQINVTLSTNGNVA